MKVIQIKVPVTLTSGLTTPANTILVISEGYLDIKATTDSNIPSQIATFLYLNAASIINDNTPITGIADFSNLFITNILVQDYETKIAETLFVEAVYNQLVPIYTAAKLEIINI
jgi:hypothetical protein